MKCPKCRFENPGGANFVMSVVAHWNLPAHNVGKRIRPAANFVTSVDMFSRSPQKLPPLISTNPNLIPLNFWPTRS
jgi:hypothetical protein